MSRRRPLGRLVIAFGPETHDHNGKLDTDVFRRDPYDPIYSFRGLIHLLDDVADPFTATWFGQVVRALLTGSSVVLTDPAFDDPKYRRRWEQAFRRTFPDLNIDQVSYGDVSSISVEDADPSFVIDDDVYDEGDMGSNERIIVDSDASTASLVTALTSAASRMMSVGEDGQEYPEGPADDIYTPNYSSEVTLDENGYPGFYIDCKSVITPPMADRFRKILVEEMKKVGVASAHVRVPD